MPPACDCLASLGLAVSFDHRDGRVVHEHDHGGRAAGARYAFDGLRGDSEAETRAAHVWRAEQAEDAGLAKRLDAWARKCAVLINVARGRSDHVIDHTGDGVMRVRGR